MPNRRPRIDSGLRRFVAPLSPAGSLDVTRAHTYTPGLAFVIEATDPWPIQGRRNTASARQRVAPTPTVPLTVASRPILTLSNPPSPVPPTNRHRPRPSTHPPRAHTP